MLSSVFIFSALLLWGFPSLPSAQHCHRLEFKFSKHFSEAGLRSGWRNNIDWVPWISKEGTKQKLFGEWRLAKLKKTKKQQQPMKWSMARWYSFSINRLHNITFLLLDSWLRDAVTQTAVLWLHPLRFNSTNQIISASRSALPLRIVCWFYTHTPTPTRSLFPVCCQVLHEEWARYSAFYKYQPIDLVR